VVLGYHLARQLIASRLEDGKAYSRADGGEDQKDE
jgi:hypothetical protein